MAKIIRESTDRKREGVKVYYKVLVDGRKSAFLTICNGGKREYECLHKYLLPEKTPADRLENKKTRAEIEAAKNAELAKVLAGSHRTLSPIVRVVMPLWLLKESPLRLRAFHTTSRSESQPWKASVPTLAKLSPRVRERNAVSP